MLVQLKYKNDLVPGFFISDEGKIYDENGVEQNQYICSTCPYYRFKKREVHKMMAHSFYGYKEGFDVHHLNQIKTDNRLQNLVYLTRAEHLSLHKIGNKYCLGKKLSDEHKAKIGASRKGRKHSKQTKEKMRDSQKKKQVYCVELNKVFAGINIAAKELSLFPFSISQCCKGKLKTCGGYHFQFRNV